MASQMARKEDSDVFHALLSESGLIFSKGKNVLKTDVNTFKRTLAKGLKTHPHYPSVIDKFIEGLYNDCANPTTLRAMLMAVEVAKGSKHGLAGSQESTIKMLLGNDDLQPSVITFLLEKIPEYMMDEEDTFHASDIISMPKLIIGQLRWLDRIIDSQALTTKLMEMISIAPLNIQRDIIGCLPEIIDDKDHGRIVDELRELLEMNTQLMVPVLDALANLSLPNALLDTVRNQILGLLQSVDIDDLPVAVKFILRTTVPANALEVVGQLRKSLDLQSVDEALPNMTSSQSTRGMRFKTDRVGESLTMEAVKSGIRFQKEIAEAWLKAIQTVERAADHRALDIFVLLVMYNMAQYKRPVEILIRRKIRNGHFTRGLLNDVFRMSHIQLVQEYFPSVLALCTTLLSSAEQPIESFARAAYQLVYRILDANSRQQIIGALVTHIGSSSDHEADAALDALLGLVQWDAAALAPYSIFVKGILDYLDNLSMDQTRKLFAVLSLLAFVDTTGEACIQDDVHMVIRKQLASNLSRYKRIGVIGAVSVVRYMAVLSDRDPQDSSLYEEQSVRILAPESEEVDTLQFSHRTGQITEARYQYIVSLLDLLVASVKVPDVQALLYDELAHCLLETKLDPSIVTYINDNIASPFQDLFIIDLDMAITPSNNEGEDQLDPWLNVPPLDVEVLGREASFSLDKEVASIIVNILALLLSQEPGAADSLAALCAQFKLLQLCERQITPDGGLGGIDALLGCPLLMFESSKVTEDTLQAMTQSQRETVCHAQLYALNWMRELLNAYASQDDPEMHGKVIMRLQNIVDLEAQLETCLVNCPYYSVPQFLLNPDDRGAKKTMPTLSQKPLKETTLCKPGKVDKSAMMQKVRPYFRELELEALVILKWNSTMQHHMLDTCMENTNQIEIIELKLPHVRFLLDDLALKLNHVFGPKKPSFLSTNKKGPDMEYTCLKRYTMIEVIDKVIDLLPALCTHLETLVNQYQTVLEENDGTADLVDPSLVEQIVPCINLLLKCFTRLFTSDVLRSCDQRHRLEAVLTVFGTRTRDMRGSIPTLDTLCREAFDYLAKFGPMLPSLSTCASLFRLHVALCEALGNTTSFLKLLSVQAGVLLMKVQNNATIPIGEKGMDGEEGLKGEEIVFCLQHHVCASDHPISTLENLVDEVLPKLLDAGGSKGWMVAVAHIKGVCNGVVTQLKKPDQQEGSGDEDVANETGRVERRMDRLNQLVLLFSRTAIKVKGIERRSIIAVLLRTGRAFLEAFLKHAMPFIVLHFRSFKDSILGMLKSLQHLTRILQTMCGHTKVSKDTGLTNYVPGLKKAMEIFIFRVKAMLEVNNCREAFWLGNLKHKNLQGQEVSSQAAIAEEESEESEEEEVEIEPIEGKSNARGRGSPPMDRETAQGERRHDAETDQEEEGEGEGEDEILEEEEEEEPEEEEEEPEEEGEAHSIDTTSRMKRARREGSQQTKKKSRVRIEESTGSENDDVSVDDDVIGQDPQGDSEDSG